MNRTCGLLVAAVSCGVAIAQQVPDIDDVYAVDQAAAFGPAAQPGEVVDRFVERIGECDRIDYAVRVSYPRRSTGESVGIEGSVAIGRTPGGDLDRFRIELKGAMPGAGAIDLLLGSTGEAFYVIDRLQRTFAEFEGPFETTPFGRLAHHVLVSELPVGGVAVAEPRPAANPREGLVHLVDEAYGEHLYGEFPEIDGLPRLIERVVPDSAGAVEIVRVQIMDLRIDDAGAVDEFEPAAPEGYLQTPVGAGPLQLLE